MTEHEACLQRIDALERELFPEWFPEPQAPVVALMNKMAMIPRADLRDPPRELELRPGFRWPVTNHDDVRPMNYTQVFRQPFAHEWVEDPKTGALIPEKVEPTSPMVYASASSTPIPHFSAPEPKPRLVIVTK